MIRRKINIAPGYNSTLISLDAWTSIVYLETPTHTAISVEMTMELDRWVPVNAEGQ